MAEDTQQSGKIANLLQVPASRRDFLKISGTGVAGTVLTANLLGFLISADASSAGQKRTVWATASGAIVHDSQRCTGCRLCETNCTMHNDGKAHPHIGRIKIGRNLNYGIQLQAGAFRNGDGQFGSLKLLGETCRQCQEPFCGNACPVGAISADTITGARSVDTAVCIGCGSCQEACPWQMATVDPVAGKSTKCALCNGDPHCVRFCPNGAVRFLPWDEVVRLYRQH